LTFAVAMMIGVALTLMAVAALTIWARDWVLAMTARHGASVDRISRALDALAGMLLVAIGLRELLK
jgi:nickel/cobalt exporter